MVRNCTVTGNKSINRQTGQSNPQGTDKKRFMNKKNRIILLAAMIFAAVSQTFAQGNGLAGINEATSMVTSYFDPGTKLIYAIGAVVGLIGGIRKHMAQRMSQMVAGKDAPTFGEAKNSWLTGTAAWTFFNISQYILGIQPTLDGLRVDPCIPHTLSGFTVTRRYRGAVYHITVDNTAGVQHGIKAVTVDGKTISGNVLPLAAAGTEVTVQVTMG